MASNSQQNSPCYASDRHTKLCFPSPSCFMKMLSPPNKILKESSKTRFYIHVQKTYFQTHSTLHHKWSHFFTGSLSQSSPISMLKEDMLRAYLLTRNISPSDPATTRYSKWTPWPVIFHSKRIPLPFPKGIYTRILTLVLEEVCSEGLRNLPLVPTTWVSGEEERVHQPSWQQATTCNLQESAQETRGHSTHPTGRLSTSCRQMLQEHRSVLQAKFNVSQAIFVFKQNPVKTFLRKCNIS